MSWPVQAATIDEIFQKLRAKTQEQLQSEGFTEHDIRVHQSIDMRYRHQIHEISVPVETRAGIGESDLANVCQTFARFYEERYGKDSGHSEGGMEMVTFRVRGTGVLGRPHLREYESGSSPK
jgi:N-methylhydantoinase A